MTSDTNLRRNTSLDTTFFKPLPRSCPSWPWHLKKTSACSIWLLLPVEKLHIWPL